MEKMGRTSRYIPMVFPFGTHQSVHPPGRYRMVSPFVMIIFGATGDLTARKLMPALYSLLSQKILPDRFFVVGFARRRMSHQDFRNMMSEALEKFYPKPVKEEVWRKLSQNIYYQQGYFEDGEPYQKLVELLSTFDEELGACITRFFYLATPPQNYSTILSHLHTSKLSEGCGQGSNKWTRILIEKPFGKDINQARMLEEQLSKTFEEKQVYRIDHYLAKETMQNILAFRFANGIFEPIWNKDSIDHIQITLAESEGVGTRGQFYEGVGALRDVAQNHLMGMLAYVAMEEPQTMAADSIRSERVKALKFLRRFKYKGAAKDIVRGQYEGFRNEKNVDPSSNTETFAAAKLFIENSRWSGVPFFVRTGKRLKKTFAQISVHFKKPTHRLFETISNGNSGYTNVLTFHIQPREGITLQMVAKEPGFGYKLQNVLMDFSYEKSFNREIADSYERVLLDSMIADQTLFATNEGFKATWELVSDIMQIWEKEKPVFPNYKAGSWGPEEAIKLIERDGRSWMSL